MSFDPIAYAMAKAYSDSKGGYTEYSAPIEIIPEMQADAQGEFLASAMPKAGDEITVFIDGVKHVKTASVGTVAGLTLAYIGNCAEVGLPETKDNFGVAFMEHEGNVVFFVYDSGYFEGKETFTISATAITKTVVPIKPEFLPGVCLPVVELTTEPNGNGTEKQLTAEESAKLTEALDKQLPPILRFPFAEATMTAVAMVSKNEDGGGFVIPIGSAYAVQFIYDDGTWVVFVGGMT